LLALWAKALDIKAIRNIRAKKAKIIHAAQLTPMKKLLRKPMISFAAFVEREGRYFS
jgi:hypothetical protein